MKLQRSDPEIDTLVSRIQKNELDLQPEFQRGEIWDLKRRQRLIDTVLRRWYVPAVHIVETAAGEVVLDGQQRLAAIRSFYDDEFAIDGDIEPRNERIVELDGRKYSQLDAATQRAIGRFVIPVITLRDYDPEEPNELFFRLNQSYNLTPPEKRNALHGTARNQVKSLVREFEASGLLAPKAVGFNNNRLAYDDIVSRACVSLQLDTLRKHINNAVVEEIYRQREGFAGKVVGVLERGGDALLRQIRNSPNRVKFNKGTLQTWLIYSSWAPPQAGPLPERLLAEFEAQRLAVRRGDSDALSLPRSVRNILGLYDDRASYRVTDVSSVLIRDLAIHIFSNVAFGTPVGSMTADLIHDLETDESSPQQRVAEYIEHSQWGSGFLESALR
ncbi:DUF262 domain-containing protein [Ruicaihuangia caeni]|uniref:DUF262 domain-containing protein n=1 Tax=Ruicaihuangia caeni TaxID=3042517 RepID=UPI00338DA64F